MGWRHRRSPTHFTTLYRVYSLIILFRWSSPHLCNSSITAVSDRPCTVISYKTVGGKVSYTVRFTNWLTSRSFNSFDKVLSVMPFTSLANCRNRFGSADNIKRIKSFHFPSSTSRASLIDSRLAGHVVPFSISCVTIRRDSTFRRIVKLRNFASSQA